MTGGHIALMEERLPGSPESAEANLKAVSQTIAADLQKLARRHFPAAGNEPTED